MNISFLGGLGEIGMNMYIYETKSTAIVVDCGVMFADFSLPGVDLIIPDFNYINQIKEKVKAIILTHGHEDHIGAVSYLLQKINAPIYGGKLTLNLLKHKLVETKIKANLNEIYDLDTITIDDILVTFLQINHSIPDTFAIKINDGYNSFIHISDFKIDKTPISQKPFSAERYLKFIDKDTITGLLIDSTSCQNEGKSFSESSIKDELYKIILNAKGRVFFTTFSSNLDRILQVFQICEAIGRKVVIEGRSILKNINIATNLGYLKYNSDNITDLSKAKKLEDNKICYIISGCQGEVNSTLYKIVSKERVSLQIKEGDLFIISSRVIPGNEKNLGNAINHIYYNGGEVIDIEKKNIHVSGHAFRDDIKEITSLTKPKYFIPIHGSYTHLRKNIQNIVEDLSFNISNCIFTENGKKLTFDNSGTLENITDIHFGKSYIDLRGNFEFQDEQLRIRKNLARDGILIFHYYIKDNKFNIEMMDSVGFDLTDELHFYIKKKVNENFILLFESSNMDKLEFEQLLAKYIKKLLKKRIDRRPEIKIFCSGLNNN